MIEYYAQIKLLPMSCAWRSICGFILRGTWSLRGSAILAQPLARKIPISIDTLLLASALTLAALSDQWPLQQSWLTAKLVALLAYILLGMVALHWGKTGTQRLIAFAAAITVFAYLLAVASQRTPYPFFGHISG